MNMQPAVRIGGKKAPRRVARKKTPEVDNDVKVKNALALNNYKLHSLGKIDTCSIHLRSGDTFTYEKPTIDRIHGQDKNNPVAGYLIRTGIKHEDNAATKPQIHLRDLAELVKNTKGVDISSLVERAEQGDKSVIPEILKHLQAGKE